MQMMFSKGSRPALCALVALSLASAISSVVGADDENSATPVARVFSGEINGEGTIVGPNGGQPEFDIVDVENEQVTKKFLEGEFAYSDLKSHVVFETGKITTVTIKGNTATFIGKARFGAKGRHKVTFTVNITANQNPTIGDTFSITLSNGYSASGNLTHGFISIDLR